MVLTIAIDFDRVLAPRTTGRGTSEIPDPPTAGAIAWIRGLLRAGCTIAIHGPRNSEGVACDAHTMQTWFRANGLTDDEIDRLQFLPEKPAAVRAALLVDDQAWQFRSQFPTIEEIRAFRPRRPDDEPEPHRCR